VTSAEILFVAHRDAPEDILLTEVSPYKTLQTKFGFKMCFSGMMHVICSSRNSIQPCMACQTQPYPPKTAPPHKAAAKISMLKVGHASMGSTLGEAQEWNIKGHFIEA
jgi:hypothetical protein